jgi:RecA-family ATPase
MVRAVPLADYVVLERPSLNWLIPDLLPKPGMLLLLGEPFAGKSFLAFQLALMLAQGGMFLHKKCRQSRVLYLQFDPSELVWRDRILSIQKAGVNLAGPIFMVHPDDNRRNMHILTLEHQRFLQECLVASQPDVVIIDVLREIHSCDEQDSTQMKQVGDALMQIFHGVSIVLIHHTKKLDAEKPIEVINSSRGSSYITGKADATWLLHQGRLHTVSRFGAPAIHNIERLPCGLWRV